jgi:hypothetical protein
MRPINVAIVLIMLITSAHALEQKAAVQIDAAPIEEPPLPRPKPSLHDVTASPKRDINDTAHVSGTIAR